MSIINHNVEVFYKKKNPKNSIMQFFKTAIISLSYDELGKMVKIE